MANDLWGVGEDSMEQGFPLRRLVSFDIKNFLTQSQEQRLLGVVKDEVRINAHFGVQALGKGHRDATAATHNLAELRLIDT